MKTRKIAAVVLCVLSVVAIICFRLISAPLTGAVTAAELGSALGALSLLPTVLSVCNGRKGRSAASADRSERH